MIVGVYDQEECDLDIWEGEIFTGLYFTILSNEFHVFTRHLFNFVKSVDNSVFFIVVLIW